eukprot:m.36891 g.36891  ORF g.36891 m.36891 type:complete len:714 (+) comp5803_c0_seq3:209-2350(+)
MADPPSSPLSPRSPRGSGGSISSQGSTGSHPHGSEGRPHLRSSHPAIASSPLASARLPLRRSHSLDGSPGTALPLRSPDDPRQRRRPSPTQPRSPLANPPSGGARSDIRRSSNSQFQAHMKTPRRSPLNASPADAPRHSFDISRPIAKLTAALTATYKRCQPEFAFDPTTVTHRVLTVPSTPCGNDNHDNRRADYILRINDQLGEGDDHRYVILGLLGQGTFGQVVKCRDLVTNRIVAVKVVKNSPQYREQSKMEISILRSFVQNRGHPHPQIVNILAHFEFRNHLCMVFELLSISLYDLLSQNAFRGFSLRRVRLFCQQILDALSALHAMNIVHCDLKPENVLLAYSSGDLHACKGRVKLIDFGSACMQGAPTHTYIQSRFYRAPEVLVGYKCSTAIDLWSLGCVAAELFLGLPLFPGGDEFDQLFQICRLLGPLASEILRNSVKVERFYSVARGPERSLSFEPLTHEQAKSRKAIGVAGRFNICSLSDFSSCEVAGGDLPNSDERASFVQFLSATLQLDPRSRISAADALTLPFFQGPSSPAPSSPLPTRDGGFGLRQQFGRLLSAPQLSSMQSPPQPPPGSPRSFYFSPGENPASPVMARRARNVNQHPRHHPSMQRMWTPGGTAVPYVAAGGPHPMEGAMMYTDPSQRIVQPMAYPVLLVSPAGTPVRMMVSTPVGPPTGMVASPVMMRARQGPSTFSPGPQQHRYPPP